MGSCRDHIHGINALGAAAAPWRLPRHQKDQQHQCDRAVWLALFPPGRRCRGRCWRRWNRQNDTNDIDGVVIAGAYLHSDGFETIALWPIDYVPIHLDRAFHEFDALRGAFHAYAERAMTAAIVDGTSDEMTKGPILDISFDADGKTFVKPAQRFWTHGAHAKGEERSDESIAGGAPISRFGKIPIRTRYVFGSRTACL